MTIEKIETTVLLFGAIQAARKHESDPEKANILVVFFCSIFMLDFIQCWFHVYSIYLAGPRTSKV